MGRAVLLVALLAVAQGPADATTASGTVYATTLAASSVWPPAATLPFAAPGLVGVRHGVQALASAGTHWVCLAGGEALTIGGNSDGQLGDGTTTDRDDFVKVEVAGDVQAVSAGDAHTLFLLSDGSVMATGKNNVGQLGDGTTNSATTPVTLALENVTAVSAGAGRHSAFLKADGTVLTTGWGANGELGHFPEYSTATLNPQRVDSLTDMQAVSVGGSHTVFLRQNGEVWVTGDGGQGQLGLGSVTSVGRGETPVMVDVNGSKVQVIAASKFNSFFVTDEGMAWATGLNTAGTLGDGSTENRFTPVPVLGGVQSVSCWNEHALFLKSDGSVYATGQNGDGELGTPAHLDARNEGGQLVLGPISVPAQVVINNATRAYAGDRYSLFLATSDAPDFLSVSVAGKSCATGTPINGTEVALEAPMSHRERRSVQCDVGYYGAVTVECLYGALSVLESSCTDSCDAPTPAPTAAPTPNNCSADAGGEDQLLCQDLKVAGCPAGEVGVRIVNCSAEASASVVVDGCAPACTGAPSPAPTGAPTPAPAGAPTPAPASAPAPEPAGAPTPEPTNAPHSAPGPAPPPPTSAPTRAPTDEPAAAPTPAPTVAAATSDCESGGVVSVDGASVNVTASLGHEGQRSVACPAGSLGAVVVECWNGSMRVFSHDCTASPAAMVENATTVQQPVEQGSATIVLSSSAGLAVGDRIRISGCGYSEVRTIIGIGSVQLDLPLEFSYPEGAVVEKEPAPDAEPDPEAQLISVETVTIVLAGALALVLCCCAVLLVCWRNAVKRLRSGVQAAERRIGELEASLEKQGGPTALEQRGQAVLQEPLEEPPARGQRPEGSPQDSESSYRTPISREFLDFALEEQEMISVL